MLEVVARVGFSDAALPWVPSAVNAGIRVFIVLGVVFAALAAFIGSLIEVEELQHHRLARVQVIGEVARVAIVTLAVFLVVALVAAAVLLPLFHVELYPGPVIHLP